MRNVVKSKAQMQAMGKVAIPDAVAIFARCLERDSRLPEGFWQNTEGQIEVERGFACVRYVAQTVLGCTTRAAVLGITCRDLNRNRLSAFLGKSRLPLHDILDRAFPEYDIMPWELGHVPNRYWSAKGGAAAVAALRWWLTKRELSAADVYKRLVSPVVGEESIRSMLDRDGLGGLYQACSARQCGLPSLQALLHTVDPTITYVPPKRRQKAVRQQYGVRCELCHRPYLALRPHMRRVHGCEPHGNAVAPIVRFQRQQAAKKTRKKDTCTLGATSLSIPVQLWPVDAPYARIRVNGQATRIQIIPTTTGGWGTRRVRQAYYRWVLCIPSPLAAELRRCGARCWVEDGIVRISAPGNRAPEQFHRWAAGKLVHWPAVSLAQPTNSFACSTAHFACD